VRCFLHPRAARGFGRVLFERDRTLRPRDAQRTLEA
jgi:hypothetical protein